jgi:hypothetical protein
MLIMMMVAGRSVLSWIPLGVDVPCITLAIIWVRDRPKGGWAGDIAESGWTYPLGVFI